MSVQKPTISNLNEFFSGNARLFFAIAGVAVAAVVGSFVYGYMRIAALEEQAQKLREELASSNALHGERADTLARDISEVNGLVREISRVLSDSNQTAQEVQQKVNQISKTVGTLEKLSETDPELLRKYSKIYFLNENYAPERLVEIEKQYLYSEDKPEQIHVLVAPYLKNLFEQATREGVVLYVKSAYRSFDEQKSLKSIFRVTYGVGSANQFSADQGYSEHQLGTTVDFITTDLNGQVEGFENTEAYQWMQNNAYKHGFVLSYPPNNPSYIFEPWHWRYVGVRLATFLHNQNKYFYDLEQREIDEYLVDVFE